MEYLSQHIESLVFTSEQPISFKDIKECLDEAFERTFEEEEIQQSIDALQERYKERDYSFELLAIGGGYHFMTKGAYHHTIGTYLRQNTKKRLSTAALETLAILAYKQPVTKSMLENIRGVSCDYSVQKLLEKELVTIIGRSDGPGRPLLYGTSEKFLNYFGLKSLDELPKPKDFKEPENAIGEAAPVDEHVLPEQPAENTTSEEE